jgi:tRNA nucleotidyltransferase (CCA-adding enzyme)
MRFQQYINEQALKGWKDYIKSNKMLKASIKILDKIEKKGYKAWIVGGSVRDVIIGKEPHDIDIATTCPMDVLDKIWKTYDIGASKDFGIVTVKEGGYDFEIAQLRGESKYDGRKPEAVTFNVELKDDLSRRDLTINAMAIDKNGNIIDKFNGQKAIKNKTLRTVGNPYERFSEDFLRIMRVARFAAKLGFDIDKDTKKAATKLSGNITKLSPERIKEEILKSAGQSGDKFAKYILLLDELKILKHILPELKQLQYSRENPTHHPETVGKGGSPFAHTIEALKASDTKDPLKNLAIALHDVGKGTTFSDVTPGKSFTYYGHDKEAIKLIETIAKRLKMSNNEKEAMLYTATQHMKFHKLKEMKPSKIFKIVNDDNFDILVAVAKADEFSRGEKFQSNKDFEASLKRAIEIKEKWGKKKAQKSLNLVSGNHIMELLGIKPGKKVGEIKKKVEDWILDTGNTKQEDIDKFIMDNRKRKRFK